MKTVSSPRPRALLPAAVIAGLVAAVFGATVGFSFLSWDDDVNVTENPYLTTGSPAQLVELWKAPYAGLYVPVTYTWWWVGSVLSRWAGVGVDPDPRIYHAGNVLLHLACAWLAFLLLRRLLRNEAGALAGAALFAVHPLQAEVVSWVTASKDLLSALLSLAALLLHLRFRDRGGTPLRLAALAAFALAVMAKPSAVVAPGLALLIDVVGFRRPVRESAVTLIPWAALAGVFFLVTRTQQPEDVLRFDLPLWTRPLVALDSLAFYLAKLVAPLRLVPDYGRTPALVLESGAAAWTWTVPVAIAAAVFRFRRDRRWTLAAGWFLLALSPVLGLVPFDYQNISTVADRYLYLALLGPALAFGAVVASHPRRPVLVAASALVLGLGFLANRQSARWTTTEALFEYTLRLHPESFSAHNNLGVDLAKRGRPEEAAAHFSEVIRLDPGYFRGWVNRGRMREKIGQLEEAAADLREGLRIAPGYVPARLSLAGVLESLGRGEEAERELAIAYRSQPDSPEAHNRLGVRAFSEGALQTAESHFREAVRLRPGYSEAHNNLANCLVREGRPAEALPHYEEALRIDPDYYNAHLNLGKVLLRSTDRAGAIAHLERALELGGPNPELERRLKDLKAGGLSPAPPPAGTPPAETPTAGTPPAGDQSR